MAHVSYCHASQNSAIIISSAQERRINPPQCCKSLALIYNIRAPDKVLSDERSVPLGWITRARMHFNALKRSSVQSPVASRYRPADRHVRLIIIPCRYSSFKRPRSSSGVMTSSAAYDKAGRNQFTVKISSSLRISSSASCGSRDNDIHQTTKQTKQVVRQSNPVSTSSGTMVAWKHAVALKTP